jgi:hypothetical protein
VARGELGNARCTDGVFPGTLENEFVEMMTAALSGQTVHVESRGGEDPLPRPFAPGMWGLSHEGPGKLDSAERKPVSGFCLPVAFSQPARGVPANLSQRCQ